MNKSSVLLGLFLFFLSISSTHLLGALDTKTALAGESDLTFWKDTHKDSSKKHVHFMHLDGYRPDVFKKLLDNGQLPHFAFLLTRAKVSYTASTVDKSETMKVIESYLTSQRNTYITGWWEFSRDQFNFKNFWIDPAEVINYELGMSFPVVPTIYDFLDYNKQNITAGFSLHRRSVPFNNYSRNFAEGLSAVYDHTYYKQAHASMSKVLAMYERIANDPKENLPALSTSLLASADEMAHLRGVTVNDELSRSVGPEYCLKRKKTDEDRAKDPFERIFSILDESQTRPQEGIVWVDKTFVNGGISESKGLGHFSQVKFGKRHFYSQHTEARRFCILLPEIDTYKNASTSGDTSMGKLSTHTVLPEYAMGMILIDIQLGRLMNTLRSIHFDCGKAQKCFVAGAGNGLEKYIRAQKRENSLFENTLFVFTGDHGMADSRSMMAKRTAELDEYGRDPRTSLEVTFIENLNASLKLQNPDLKNPTAKDAEIGIDGNTVTQEVSSYYQFKDWQSEEIQEIVASARTWAESLFQGLVSDIRNQEYKKYWYLGCFKGPIINSQIKSKLAPYEEKAINLLIQLYLRGNAKYVQAEKEAHIAYYNRNIRLIYGGAALNNAELFVPKLLSDQTYSWTDRPSFDQIQSYRGGKDSTQTLIEALKTNPGVGLIFVRKNNDKISPQSPVPREMQILVMDRFDNQGLITVVKDEKTKELLFSYESQTQQDPLGYEDVQPTSGQFRTYNEWNDLSVTQKHYYHNAVAGMGGYLYSNNPSIGDITLMRSQGWNFGDNAGGHGGLHREEKVTLMLVSGPGIAPGELMATTKYKTVASLDSVEPKTTLIKTSEKTYPTVLDIAPTILNWLEFPDEALPQFAKDGFENHLKQWIADQENHFADNFISVINDLIQVEMPGLKLDLSVHKKELERLLKFMGTEQPRLPDPADAHQDGNILRLRD